MDGRIGENIFAPRHQETSLVLGKRGNRPCGVLGRDLSDLATYRELGHSTPVYGNPTDRFALNPGRNGLNIGAEVRERN